MSVPLPTQTRLCPITEQQTPQQRYDFAKRILLPILNQAAIIGTPHAPEGELFVVLRP